MIASPDGRTADMGGRLGTKAFTERVAAVVGQGGSIRQFGSGNP